MYIKCRVCANCTCVGNILRGIREHRKTLPIQACWQYSYQSTGTRNHQWMQRTSIWCSASLLCTCNETENIENITQKSKQIGTRPLFFSGIWSAAAQIHVIIIGLDSWCASHNFLFLVERVLRVAHSLYFDTGNVRAAFLTP